MLMERVGTPHILKTCSHQINNENKYISIHTTWQERK